MTRHAVFEGRGTVAKWTTVHYVTFIITVLLVLAANSRTTYMYLLLSEVLVQYVVYRSDSSTSNRDWLLLSTEKKKLHRAVSMEFTSVNSSLFPFLAGTIHPTGHPARLSSNNTSEGASITFGRVLLILPQVFPHLVE